jgi:dienelactone hydrolase/ketosteroid isomerase-like protein
MNTNGVSAGEGGDPAASGERVTFESEGETIVGRLFSAAYGEGPAPGVVIIGPENYQKEQAPSQYAPRLAALGYAALIFDPRYRGESGGEPRCFESPAAKREDLRAALAYLSGLPEVDGTRLALLGICFGSSYVLPVAADDPRVRAVATVAAHLRDRTADVSWMGSEAAVAERLARGRAARDKYETTGEVDYVPAVDHDRGDVGMPGELVWSWYQLWADRGLWENRYAVMSDAEVFSYESLSAAARLITPLLMVHSDQCAQPEAAHRHFAVVPTERKQLRWEGETRHFQYYDDPAVIDRAVWSVADWFSRHLGPGERLEVKVRAVRDFYELLHRKDLDAWSALWHERGTIVSPYPPDGFEPTIDGKENIVATFGDLFAHFDSFESELTGVYPASNSGAVCVEYRNRARLVDGTEYTNDNVAIFIFEDGLIREYHDYYDPRRFQTVVDALSKETPNSVREIAPRTRGSR